MGILKIKNNGSWLNVISDYAARAIVAAHNLASNAHADQFNEKQSKTDILLSTVSKNVVGAINEVDSIALGANQALGVANYQTLVTMMNGATASAYRVGQNIYVQTLNVPDVWVYSVESSSVPYTYTTDEALATALDSGAVQMGYYKISKLEGQKVDLTNYVKNTDYASDSVGGTIKTDQTYTGTWTYNGKLLSDSKTYAQYQNYLNDTGFVSKGTLENVINGALVRKVASPTTGNIPQLDASGSITNGLTPVNSQGIPIATSISSASTNSEVPSAKSVVDYVEKTLELIETITLTSDVANITRTQDTQGNNYNFKEIYIFLEIPQTENNASIWFKGCYGNDTYTDMRLYNAITTAPQRGYMAFKQFYPALSGTFRGQNSPAMATIATETDNTFMNCPNGNPYTKIEIWSQQAQLIPSGTVLKIYGLRR